ncbi:MAG: hypothetical protein PVJ50_04260 [Desulfobacterales bacterium]|jgi:hypothetical protein
MTIKRTEYILGNFFIMLVLGCATGVFVLAAAEFSAMAQKH